MDHWIRGFIHAIVKAGVKLYSIMKYVDDVNLVMAVLDLGTRWVDDSLVHDEEWEEQDRAAGRTKEDVTMVAMRVAADSIIPWLQFTMDEPDQHEHKTVPMLDLCVWVRHPEESDAGRVGHTRLVVLREAHQLLQGPQGQLGVWVEEQGRHTQHGGVPPHAEHHQTGHVGAQSRTSWEPS